MLFAVKEIIQQQEQLLTEIKIKLHKTASIRKMEQKLLYIKQDNPKKIL